MMDLYFVIEPDNNTIMMPKADSGLGKDSPLF
jgi:hypothetical protein